MMGFSEGLTSWDEFDVDDDDNSQSDGGGMAAGLGPCGAIGEDDFSSDVIGSSDYDDFDGHDFDSSDQVNTEDTC
jgi:hypothetical protein